MEKGQLNLNFKPKPKIKISSNPKFLIFFVKVLIFLYWNKVDRELVDDVLLSISSHKDNNSNSLSSGGRGSGENNHVGGDAENVVVVQKDEEVPFF